MLILKRVLTLFDKGKNLEFVLEQLEVCFERSKNLKEYCADKPVRSIVQQTQFFSAKKVFNQINKTNDLVQAFTASTLLTLNSKRVVVAQVQPLASLTRSLPTFILSYWPSR